MVLNLQDPLQAEILGIPAEAVTTNAGFELHSSPFVRYRFSLYPSLLRDSADWLTHARVFD